MALKEKARTYRCLGVPKKKKQKGKHDINKPISVRVISRAQVPREKVNQKERKAKAKRNS